MLSPVIGLREKIYTLSVFSGIFLDYFIYSLSDANETDSKKSAGENIIPNDNSLEFVCFDK